MCGEGYTSKLETTGPIICDYAPECTYSDNDDCYDSDTIKNNYKSTLCGGGCSSWKYTLSDCSSGKYCSDPGDAYCKSCSSSCDDVCQSSACYGTDPDCNSDGSTKTCGGGGGFCSGSISTIVKDSYGTSISDIKVYVDNVYKGNTGDFGKITTDTIDSYCGKSHTIKTFCSDGTFCGSTSTTINYNGDDDDVNFNCNSCIPYPELVIDVVTPTSYEIDEKINLDVMVTDNFANPVSGVYVRFCDPFSVIGCPSQYYYGFTGTSGKLIYTTYATKLGAHTFKISASKDDYNPDTITKSVTVGSFDGKT